MFAAISVNVSNVSKVKVGEGLLQSNENFLVRFKLNSQVADVSELTLSTQTGMSTYPGSDDRFPFHGPTVFNAFQENFKRSKYNHFYKAFYRCLLTLEMTALSNAPVPGPRPSTPRT